MPSTGSRSRNCTATFFALPEVERREVGAPLLGLVCPCFSSLPMGHTWSLFFCQRAIEEAMWATPSLDKDTWSCVVPRSSDESNDAESSRRAPKKFFYVYVDNLGILGTSRVNVDEDLRMAVQTLRSRGLDTHEEIVHSDTAIALGIHIDLHNMLVSVAPMRLWRLKTRSSLGAALSDSTWKNMGGAPGAHDLCGCAQTGRAQCAFCAQ